MHNSWGAKSWKKIEGLNIIIWKGGGTKLIIIKEMHKLTLKFNTKTKIIFLKKRYKMSQLKNTKLKL